MNKQFRNFLSTSLVFLAFNTCASLAHAEKGGGSTGGGSFTEMQLSGFLNNIADYLNSDEGRADFPQIAEYDTSHPNATVASIARTLSPSLVHSKVSINGSERDCVSGSEMTEQGLRRYFQCNADNFPALPSGDSTEEVKSEFYGDMYRLVFHEALVQAGLEDQSLREIPSDYPIAKDLKVHWETVRVIKPGAKTLGSKKLVCVVNGDGDADYLLESKSGDSVSFAVWLKSNFKTNPSLHMSAKYTTGCSGGGSVDYHLSSAEMREVNPEGVCFNINLFEVKNGAQKSAGKDSYAFTRGNYITAKAKNITVACSLKSN